MWYLSSNNSLKELFWSNTYIFHLGGREKKYLDHPSLDEFGNSNTYRCSSLRSFSSKYMGAKTCKKKDHFGECMYSLYIKFEVACQAEQFASIKLVLF
jgi:hypothetical protein